MAVKPAFDVGDIGLRELEPPALRMSSRRR
jgi:hypothetical protein